MTPPNIPNTIIHVTNPPTFDAEVDHLLSTGGHYVFDKIATFDEIEPGDLVIVKAPIRGAGFATQAIVLGTVLEVVKREVFAGLFWNYFTLYSYGEPSTEPGFPEYMYPQRVDISFAETEPHEIHKYKYSSTAPQATP